MSKFLSPFADNLSQPPPQDKYRKTSKSLCFPRKDVLQKHFSLWAGGQGCERPTTGAFEHSHADLTSPFDLLSNQHLYKELTCLTILVSLTIANTLWFLKNYDKGLSMF